MNEHDDAVRKLVLRNEAISKEIEDLSVEREANFLEIQKLKGGWFSLAEYPQYGNMENREKEMSYRRGYQQGSVFILDDFYMILKDARRRSCSVCQAYEIVWNWVMGATTNEKVSLMAWSTRSRDKTLERNAPRLNIHDVMTVRNFQILDNKTPRRT